MLDTTLVIQTICQADHSPILMTGGKAVTKWDVATRITDNFHVCRQSRGIIVIGASLNQLLYLYSILLKYILESSNLIWKFEQYKKRRMLTSILHRIIQLNPLVLTKRLNLLYKEENYYNFFSHYLQWIYVIVFLMYPKPVTEKLYFKVWNYKSFNLH